MNLGEIIHNYRMDNKMTLDDVAKKCGITKGYVSMLEKNVNPKTKRALSPSIETILKVSKGLSIDIDKMFEMLDDDIRIALNHESLKSVYGNIYANTNISQNTNNGTISNNIGSGDNSNTTNNYYNGCEYCEEVAEEQMRYNYSQNKDTFFAIMDNIRAMTDIQLEEVLRYTEFILSKK
jgi:transcriptional regulator with XRE-family HTH domain